MLSLSEPREISVFFKLQLDDSHLFDPTTNQFLDIWFRGLILEDKHTS